MYQSHTMNTSVKSAMTLFLAVGWGATLYVAGMIAVTVVS